MGALCGSEAGETNKYCLVELQISGRVFEVSEATQ